MKNFQQLLARNVKKFYYKQLTCVKEFSVITRKEFDNLSRCDFRSIIEKVSEVERGWKVFFFHFLNAHFSSTLEFFLLVVGRERENKKGGESGSSSASNRHLCWDKGREWLKLPLIKWLLSKSFTWEHFKFTVVYKTTNKRWTWLSLRHHLLMRHAIYNIAQLMHIIQRRHRQLRVQRNFHHDQNRDQVMNNNSLYGHKHSFVCEE